MHIYSLVGKKRQFIGFAICFGRKSIDDSKPSKSSRESNHIEQPSSKKCRGGKTRASGAIETTSIAYGNFMHNINISSIQKYELYFSAINYFIVLCLILYQEKLESQEKKIAEQQTIILGFIEKEKVAKQEQEKRQVEYRQRVAKESIESQNGLKSEMTEVFDTKVNL